MHLKFKNSAVDIPGWLVFVGLLIVDSMYANHCKKKAVVKYLDADKKPKKEEEESK